jgi:hypothetical protein
MQFPAQPKPRLALHETMQSRAQCPSLPRSTAEIHASPILPIISLPKRISKHPNEMGLVCVKTRAEQEPELGIFGADHARTEDFERALRSAASRNSCGRSFCGRCVGSAGLLAIALTKGYG